MAKGYRPSVRKDRAIRFQKRSKEDKRTGVRYDATWREEKACTAKKWYRAQHLAMHAARRMYEHVDKDLFVYDCPHCDGWHITSTPSRNRNNDQIPVKRLTTNPPSAILTRSD